MVVVSTAVCSYAGCFVHERLYLIDGSGGTLVTYDPVTLERLSLQVTGLLVGMQSLTYGHGRLHSIEFNTGLWMDQLISIHPASAVATQVGPTGISYSTFPSVKYDSTRDEFFVLYQEFTTPAELWFPDLYSIDPASGQMTYIARVSSGPQSPTFGALAMAISPAGEAFVSQPSTLLNGPGIARLDLMTGALAFLGYVPVGLGSFRDMSFDSSGRMWVIYDDGADNSKDGIYTIDPVALTFEPKLLTKDFPLSVMNAIAVVPLPAMSAYCEPSSQTMCAPTISWKGLPSATADSGFPVSVRGTPSASIGMILFGNGIQSSPFTGSTLCFAPPYIATAAAPSLPTGTGSACDGTWGIDLNPEILAAGFAPGDTLRAQWIGLDPTAPPGERRVTSDALEFDLAP
ncbi:MAG TPA: hypothetical protein VMT18_12110 [Planctomycetota bacterium]|nr:hypothetical protein [Planctomycetota bacterium]